jgi:hypothetical protein
MQWIEVIALSLSFVCVGMLIGYSFGRTAHARAAKADPRLAYTTPNSMVLAAASSPPWLSFTPKPAHPVDRRLCPGLVYQSRAQVAKRDDKGAALGVNELTGCSSGN